jgi:hypothetical protein
MTRPVGSRTIDGASMLRCMAVALTPEQQDAVRRAIVPVEIVLRADVREASTSMSTVLPLVVVVDVGMPEADRHALSEMATACGAEIVSIEHTPSGPQFAARLLEALRVAERRRLGMRGV